MTPPIPVGVLGATGTVGERLVRLLHRHPWFELAEVGASDRSAGEPLALRTSPSGLGPLPGDTAGLVLKSLDDDWDSPLLLSALPSSAAADTEMRLAGAGHLVVSNASTHRMHPLVPLVIPEVNPGHLDLVDRQPWSGGLVTNPNCVVAGVALALAPLHRAFGVQRMTITTFQAISGAGRPGPAAGDLLDNILPWIPGEEEKMGAECRKILGSLAGDGIEGADVTVSATATRVPVSHGHLASISVGFRTGAAPDQVADVLRSWRGAVAGQDLPLAPSPPLRVLEDGDRPQPRLDRDAAGGMAVTVGRIRRCPVLDVKLLVLSHNLVRGAAGAALLNAELCRARDLLSRRPARSAPGA